MAEQKVVKKGHKYDPEQLKYKKQEKQKGKVRKQRNKVSCE